MSFFLLIGHIYKKDENHQMSFKTHTNHLISSNHACFMIKFSFFVYIIPLTSLKVSISCKDIFNCYNKKLIIIIL